MNPESEINIKEITDKLPIEVVTAINSTSWVEKIRQIAKDNNLDKEKEGAFAIETTLLVFGTESPINYPDNLAENVGLDDDTVIKIAKEVDEKILTPITQALKEKGIATETTPNKEAIPSNLPMVEEGEVAHSVPHVEPAKTTEVARPNDEIGQVQSGGEPPKPKEMKTPLPDYRYPDGADPYREPLV